MRLLESAFLGKLKGRDLNEKNLHVFISGFPCFSGFALLFTIPGRACEKEKQRRDEIKNNKVITDEETAKYWTKREHRNRLPVIRSILRQMLKNRKAKPKNQPKPRIPIQMNPWISREGPKAIGAKQCLKHARK